APSPSFPLFPYTTLFRSLLVSRGGVDRRATAHLERRASRDAGDERADLIVLFLRVPYDRAQRRHVVCLDAPAERVRHEVLGKIRSEEHTSELQSLAYLVC